MVKRTLGSLLILNLVGACALESGDPTSGYNGNPIINGSPPNAPMHDAVVGLHQRVGSTVYATPFCSGTLVTPTVVVTAAHCLDTATGKKPKPTTMAPSALAIYVGNDAQNDPNPAVFAVNETKIHSAYDRIRITNDIAAIRLVGPVPETLASPVAHLPSALGFVPGDIGDPVNIAGFGVDEHNSVGVKLQTDVTLGGFGCSVEGCYDQGDPATQISYAQPTSGPCSGDSGGPAFISRNGTPYVGGVTSYGDYYCTVYGVSTRVDAFEGWINDFIGDPNSPNCDLDGTCNPECPEGTDPDCDSTGCGDGVCGTGESCDGRYGTFACEADCPGKPKGKPSTRYCYVEGVCEGPGC